MRRIRSAFALLSALLLISTLAFANSWQTSKLMDTEKQEVPTGSTTTYNSDGQARNNGKYSQNTTARTTDNTDTYQAFTIQTPTNTYVARQKLNHPRPNPANNPLGEAVKL